MPSKLLGACCLLLGLSTTAVAQTVLACEPEWAALTRVLLPEARIHTATHGRQDPHHIEARPALIAQLRAADLAVCTGASLEAGWLPTLQERAGNPRVQDGRPGMFYAAQQVPLLNPQAGFITPFDGDVHPEGNPHLHADPRRLQAVALALSQRMQQLWPAQAAQIAQRQAQFERRWALKLQDWERRAAPLRGRAVAAQHGSFAYLWHWLGLRQTLDLEPKPGMAPTPAHLQRVLQSLRSEPPLALVVSSYQDPRAARWLDKQLDGQLPLLSLPATVLDAGGSEALEQWFEQLLQALLLAQGQVQR
ncbi:zinc/manganese transport system substrate-binding protein [Paucibacter oligotrophus]|uniref:Zinc/manganese transport system substrate-binding protein n=1 Tax=Roseateles oligotrophus TaxID=1769250 RepID=A0A840L582_9BURK|nr:zinc ABC transporter substrate-binding protein [Roseateles oligotrophus]MBB4843704.1 zinc/manganese transport system substrate-binding protein [Roseateles oligotrophus]